MSQPYSKYQLSEKLRRLRKKFRVTSARISRGLNVTHLNFHDRNLFELSMKLWSPECLPNSPFCGGNVDVGLVFCGKKEKEIIEEVAVARSVLDVFDECLKEVRMVVANQAKEGREKDFERRWREQRFAEFDVLTRRLRLILDDSFNRQ